MKITFVPADTQPDGKTVLVAAFNEGLAFSAPVQALDEKTSGAITRALAAGRFTGALGQTLDIVAPAGIDAARILLVGLGPADRIDLSVAELAAGHAYQAVKASGAKDILIRLAGAPPAMTSAIAMGLTLAAWRFDKYRTTEPADKKPTLVSARIGVADPAAAKASWDKQKGVAEAVLYARDLVSEPANILHPEEFARRVKELSRLGLEIEVLGEKEMKKLGMGSLLGVGQGSVRESQLVIMQWKGAKASAAPVAFIGKGVCFDSGGLSLKPAAGMEEMITDMGGAAAVTGAMMALAARKAKVNAVGILGLVENMPDGAAQRPGDVVTSLSGQTIEVINTDAEGRLVLADALWYCQSRFKPRFMIDLATLTGAILISLGKEVAGLFSNDDALSEALAAAGKATGEAVWRLPLPEQYGKKLESAVADMKNIGDRDGGSITAALFLQKFVNKRPWAHLDIAGVAHNAKSVAPTHPGGATGWGVRLLDRLVADAYEG